MSLLSDRFLTIDNGANILRQISVNVCLSLGMTMVILSGGIDLSVGSVLALGGAVTAGLAEARASKSWSDSTCCWSSLVLGAVAGGLLAGLFCGLFNGVDDHAICSIPPFVATLGVMSIARGLTMLWTQGHPITGLGDPFGLIGRDAMSRRSRRPSGSRARWYALLGRSHYADAIRQKSCTHLAETNERRDCPDCGWTGSSRSYTRWRGCWRAWRA